MKISNDPAAKAQGIYTQIYWHNFFNNSDIDKIVEQCEAIEIQGAAISQDNSNIDNEVRVSKVNFHNRNDENTWIFDHLNFGVDDINSKFYHFDLHIWAEGPEFK